MTIDRPSVTTAATATQDGSVDSAPWSPRCPADEELLDAAFDGTLAQVLAALDAGADINALDENGETALHLALRFLNDSSIAHSLIERGADLSLLDRDGLTVLARLARRGERDLVRLVLDKGFPVDALSELRNKGRTALFAACVKGHSDVVEELLGAGADITRRDQHSQTALHMAASSRCARLLVDAGADLGAIDNCHPNVRGKTPLMSAVDARRTDVCLELIRLGAPLAGALEIALDKPERDLELIEQICASGADLQEICRSTELTPLHVCVYRGAVDAAECLVRYGASVAALDAAGRTPLLIAAEMDDAAMTSLLLEVGSDISAQGSNGRSFIDIAKDKPSIRAAFDAWRARAAIRDSIAAPVKNCGI